MENQLTKTKLENPQLSSFICFVKCLKYTTKRKLDRDFQLVDKNDYKGSSRKEIRKWLISQMA